MCSRVAWQLCRQQVLAASTVRALDLTAKCLSPASLACMSPSLACMSPSLACMSPSLACSFHTSSSQRHWLDARDPKHEEKLKELQKKEGNLFDQIVLEKAKNKQTFQEAVQKFNLRPDKYKRAHVEFIYASLDHIKDFHAARDIVSYKLLLDIFPKKKMVAKSPWEVEFMHYPKQQQCAIDLLDIMEYNGVIPDDEMGYQLIEIFGQKSHVFRRYQRMMYWLPKFKNANPYPVPYELPEDPRELAVMALRRMAVDLENKIDIYETSELKEATDKTFVASAMSPAQRELIDRLPSDKPVYVEGGYFVWLRYKSLIYFVLRSTTTDTFTNFEEMRNEEDDTMFDWKTFVLGKEEASAVVPVPSVHEQGDGTVLAMCITGSSSKESIASWIQFLQNHNPNLRNIPIIFTLRSPEQALQVYSPGPKNQQPG